MSDSIYFVAIIPPENTCELITGIKQDFSLRYHSLHALKLMPHITLKAPFTPREGRDPAALHWFNNIHVSVRPFEQRLVAFNCFSNARNPVIFIEPEQNEALAQLHREILNDFIAAFPGLSIGTSEQRFHPHITIGYRDLAPAAFKRAWQEYQHKPFAASFPVDNFCLLQHDKKQWNIIGRRALG